MISADSPRHSRKVTAHRGFPAYVRDYRWAQSEHCHDEIVRSYLDPHYRLSRGLTPRQRAMVRSGVRALAEEPRTILRFGLFEAAVARVTAQTPRP